MTVTSNCILAMTKDFIRGMTQDFILVFDLLQWNRVDRQTFIRSAVSYA